MPQTVRDVMTTDPVTLRRDAAVVEAARAMRDNSIGDVLVLDGGRVCGIVTDRDIAVRTVAEGRDPKGTRLGEICSGTLVCVSPTDTVERAVDLMRERSLRRLPVVDGDRPVGIVALGDLAVERDPQSVLAGVSAAGPNR